MPEVHNRQLAWRRHRQIFRLAGVDVQAVALMSMMNNAAD
jgi:hypothetical protein